MQIHDYLGAEKKKSSDDIACTCYLWKCVENGAIGSKPRLCTNNAIRFNAVNHSMELVYWS